MNNKIKYIYIYINIIFYYLSLSNLNFIIIIKIVGKIINYNILYNTFYKIKVIEI
jgi:hypothetical protein